MPELPDVEVFRRRLARRALHRPVEEVHVPDPTVLRDVSRRRLTRALLGHELTSTSRHGKHLLAQVSRDGVLALHFGMTGWLQPLRGDEKPDRGTRLILDFPAGERLGLVDLRRLGSVTLADSRGEYVDAEALGPDALSISRDHFADLLRRDRGTVKSVLMDQSKLAGIGNMYADEILFQARLHPGQPARSLDDKELGRLHRQLRRVLELAIDRNVDASRFPRTWLFSHREDGARCPRGNGVIRKYSSGGRTGYWCPDCQPGPAQTGPSKTQP